MAPHRSILALAIVVVVALVWLPPGPVGAQARAGEWRAYAADKTNSRYSPLDQINRDTASRLRVAWRQSVIPPELRERWPNATVPNVSQNTPLMVDGLLYVSTAVGVGHRSRSGNRQGRLVRRTARPPGRHGRARARSAATWRAGSHEPGPRVLDRRPGLTNHRAHRSVSRCPQRADW